MNLTWRPDTVDSQFIVGVAAPLAVGPLEQAAQRLRSWALIIGCTPAGLPFVRVKEDETLVFLPIAEQTAPHPETGLVSEWCEGGAVQLADDVEVKDISGMAGAALELEGVREAVQAFEFCPGDKHFGRGSLRVRVRAAARMQPPVAAGHLSSPEPVDAAAHAAR